MLNYKACPAHSEKSRMSVNKAGKAGKKDLILSAFLFAMLFSYTVAAEGKGLPRGGYGIIIPEKIEKLVFDPLPAGTYSVGSGGYFPTIDSAFNKLSVDGIAGEVVLEFTDDLYIAPTNSYGFLLNGPIPGAGPDSRVTIKPAENKNVIIYGTGSAAFSFLNTSYLVFDGIELTGSTTLTIHSLLNLEFDWNDCVDFIDNSDQNLIQNIIFVSEDLRNNAGIILWAPSGSNDSPDSNIVQNNIFKKGGTAVYIAASNAAINVRPTNNIIRGNTIGTEIDSLISDGIQLEKSQSTIVENNIVQNIKAPIIVGPIFNVGICSYWGNEDIIRNNVVHSVESDTGFSSVGILLSGDVGEVGIKNYVYNNMVYDIQSSSTQSNSRVTGIQAFMQQNPKIYYNSVYLSGTGSNHLGSGALYLWSDCSDVDVKNNVLVNTRDEGEYCAAAIYLRAENTIFNSDYNDLYYQTNNYNSLVNSYTGSYLSLEDWQATGQDLNSVAEMPDFIEPFLHINSSIATLLNNGATPIGGIDTDFDSEIRNATTPDIGADEFTIVSVVEEQTIPTVFALEQNYPNPFNPTTTISFNVAEKSDVKITILNAIGEEAAVLLNEIKEAGYHQIQFNASNLPSGVYFYQIKAGSFMETKKMILLR